VYREGPKEPPVPICGGDLQPRQKQQNIRRLECDFHLSNGEVSRFFAAVSETDQDMGGSVADRNTCAYFLSLQSSAVQQVLDRTLMGNSRGGFPCLPRGL